MFLSSSKSNSILELSLFRSCKGYHHVASVWDSTSHPKSVHSLVITVWHFVIWSPNTHQCSSLAHNVLYQVSSKNQIIMLTWDNENWNSTADAINFHTNFIHTFWLCSPAPNTHKNDVLRKCFFCPRQHFQPTTFLQLPHLVYKT